MSHPTQHDTGCINHYGFMRLPEVLKLIPVSRATWWNGCKDGRFPAPYRLGRRTTAWKREDILNCLESFQSTNEVG
jgi:prophage regulatory protein